MHIRELTLEEARAVVEAREPRGLFWAREADGYLGIDNLAGEAFVETFGTLEACRRWLNREEA
ncbi:hypothetical protein [Clostridia bacterium]|jgi:hypothetical protein